MSYSTAGTKLPASEDLAVSVIMVIEACSCSLAPGCEPVRFWLVLTYVCLTVQHCSQVHHCSMCWWGQQVAGLAACAVDSAGQSGQGVVLNPFHWVCLEVG